MGFGLDINEIIQMEAKQTQGTDPEELQREDAFIPRRIQTQISLYAVYLPHFIEPIWPRLYPAD